MAATNFVVHPHLGATAGIYLLVVSAAALACAAKGRFGWVAVGVATGGLGFIVGALGVATPDSLWARAFYGPARMSQASARFPRRRPSPS